MGRAMRWRSSWSQCGASTRSCSTNRGCSGASLTHAANHSGPWRRTKPLDRTAQTRRGGAQRGGRALRGRARSHRQTQCGGACLAAWPRGRGVGFMAQMCHRPLRCGARGLLSASVRRAGGDARTRRQVPAWGHRAAAGAVVWHRGRLQRDGDRLTRAVARGPFQFLQPPLHAQDRAHACRPGCDPPRAFRVSGLANRWRVGWPTDDQPLFPRPRMFCTSSLGTRKARICRESYRALSTTCPFSRPCEQVGVS